MRKKCFLLACFLCTGALAVPTVFGAGPTNAELFNIAKEAYEKGLWKPDLNAYTFGKQETYAVDGLQDIKGNDDLLAAFQKTYPCWVRLAKEAHRLYGFDIRMDILSVWFEDLKRILLQEDDREWDEVKPLLKGLGKGSLVRNLKREFEYKPVAVQQPKEAKARGKRNRTTLERVVLGLNQCSIVSSFNHIPPTNCVLVVLPLVLKLVLEERLGDVCIAGGNSRRRGIQPLEVF